jgi:hypothetical protein
MSMECGKILTHNTNYNLMLIWRIHIMYLSWKVLAEKNILYW